MNLLWNSTEEKEPPEEKVLLILGPLGYDLAMRLDGQWYFKFGDSWDQNNLEYWSNSLPTQWAEFNFPAEQILQDPDEIILKKVA
jgi:hypothetical protein